MKFYTLLSPKSPSQLPGYRNFINKCETNVNKHQKRKFRLSGGGMEISVFIQRGQQRSCPTALGTIGTNHREKPSSVLHKSFLSHPLFTLMFTNRGMGISACDLFTHFDRAFAFILSLCGGVSKRKESQIQCWKSTGRQGVVHGIFICNRFWESIRSVLGEHLYSR